MGEAAGVAATLAIDGGVAVRDVDVATLQAQLMKQGGIIDRPNRQGRPGASEGPESGLEDSIHWQAVSESQTFG